MNYVHDSYVRKSRLLRSNNYHVSEKRSLKGKPFAKSEPPLCLSLPNISNAINSPIRPPGSRPQTVPTGARRHDSRSRPQTVPSGAGRKGTLQLQKPWTTPRSDISTEPAKSVMSAKSKHSQRGSTLNTLTKNRINYMNTLPAKSTSSMKLLWDDGQSLDDNNSFTSRRSTCPPVSGRPFETGFFGEQEGRMKSPDEDVSSIDSEALMEISRSLNEREQGAKLFTETDFSSVEMQRVAENANSVEEAVRGARAQSTQRTFRNRGFAQATSGSDSDASAESARLQERIQLRSLYHRHRGWREDANLPQWVTQRPEFPGYESFIKTKRLSDALSAKPNVRKEEQIDLMCRWLTENMKNAEDYTEQQLRAIACSATLKECDRDDVVLYKGEAFQFLIVVKGSCRFESQQTGGLLSHRSDTPETGRDHVEVLYVGDCFGKHVIDPAAPVLEGVIRAAESGTEVLMLIKSNYDSQLKNYHNVDKSEAYKCLKKVDLFRTWHRSRLERVCHQLTKREYDKNEMIFRQGDPPDSVFFIQSGSVQVLKEFEVLTTNRWPVGPHSWKEKNCKTIQPFQLMTMEGPGNFFGEKSIVNNCGRTATIKTISECVIYVLGKEEFIRLLMQGKALDQALQANKYPTDSDLQQLFTSMKIKEKNKQTVIKLLNQSSSLKEFTPASGIAWLQQKDIDLYLRNTQTKARKQGDSPQQKIMKEKMEDLPSSRTSPRIQTKNSSTKIQLGKIMSPRNEKEPSINKNSKVHSSQPSSSKGLRRASQSFRNFAQSIEDGNATF